MHRATLALRHVPLPEVGNAPSSYCWFKVLHIIKNRSLLRPVFFCFLFRLFLAHLAAEIATEVSAEFTAFVKAFEFEVASFFVEFMAVITALIFVAIVVSVVVTVAIMFFPAACVGVAC